VEVAVGGLNAIIKPLFALFTLVVIIFGTPPALKVALYVYGVIVMAAFSAPLASKEPIMPTRTTIIIPISTTDIIGMKATPTPLTGLSVKLLPLEIPMVR
jgi:hypothetical protein